VVADLGQRSSLRVEVDCPGNLFGSKCPATVGDARPIKVSGHGGAVDPEAVRKLVLGRTFFICIDEFGDLLRAQ
jgi:hypothetical protein